jgi:hypothetical protein
MSKRGVRNPEPGPLAEAGAPSVQSLEQRVRRLEDAVAALQDTRMLEERVVARVGERLNHNAVPPRESSGSLVEAGRRLLPAAVESFRAHAGSVETVGRLVAPPGKRRHWLLYDLYDELRTVVVMLLDLRYRPYLSWTACLGPPMLLALLLTSGYWLRLLYPVGSLIADTPLDKLLDFFLGLLVYQILAREARRYRATFPDPAA